jgi:hypothetical protein
MVAAEPLQVLEDRVGAQLAERGSLSHVEQAIS